MTIYLTSSSPQCLPGCLGISHVQNKKSLGLESGSNVRVDFMGIQFKSHTLYLTLGTLQLALFNKTHPYGMEPTEGKMVTESHGQVGSVLESSP